MAEKAEKSEKSMSTFRKMTMSAEKKMASKLASKSQVRSVALDEDTAALVDNLHEFVQEASGKEKAHSVKKDMIKVVVKIALLLKNDLLVEEELDVLRNLRKKLLSAVNMMITFEETPFTYDGELLEKVFADCRDLCCIIVSKHLTEKSVQRTRNVFNYFGDQQTTKILFLDPKFKEHQKKVVSSLKDVVDKKVI